MASFANNKFDVCVLGGGPIGCGVVYSLTMRGFKVVLIENEDALVASASACGQSGLYSSNVSSFEETLSQCTQVDTGVYSSLNVPHDETQGGLFCQVDPWMLPIALATNATSNGASIMLNVTVNSATWSAGVWDIALSDQNTIQVAVVINCGETEAIQRSKPFTGQDTDSTELSLKSQVELFSIYGNVESVEADSPVWRSLHGDLISSSSSKVVSASKEKASFTGTKAVSPTSSILWDLKTPSLLHILGIRNTLHLSTTIGQYIVGMLSTPPVSILWPSTASTDMPTPIDQIVRCPLPSLTQLCASYAERNDGHVSFGHTQAYRVSHPITRFGLSTRPPFVAIADLPALASLIGSISKDSSLAFLKTATVASILRGGYTNCLYLVKMGREGTSVEEKWVVRKGASLEPGGDDPFFRVHRISRKAEHDCVTAAAAVGITPISHFDSDANLLAQEYISEPETFDAQRVRDCLEECVDIVKKLHCSLPPDAFERSPPFALDAFEVCRHYINVISGENPLNDSSWATLLPPDMDAVMKAGDDIHQALLCHQERWPPVCCHNDLVVGNLVRGNLGSNERRVYLIDFEYSAKGDRCFDIANLCVNSEFDLDETARVVDRYLSNNECCTAKHTEFLARVQLLKILSDLREALWALGHGCMLKPLTQDEEKAGSGDAALPQTFYINYFEQHLLRFRRSVGLDQGAGSPSESLKKWIHDAVHV